MDAYTLALSWLARRELTERQIRARLGRRQMEVGEIDAAVERLRREGALDDRRVAGAYVRTAVRLKGRGPLRLRRDLQTLGVSGPAAREAIDEALAETPEDALIDRALAKRWPATADIDRAALARIYRALLRQGFASDKVMAAIRRRGGGGDEDP
jgi:regulatory protein